MLAVYAVFLTIPSVVHCMLQNPELDMFDSLSSTERREIRTLIINMVLATDTHKASHTHTHSRIHKARTARTHTDRNEARKMEETAHCQKRGRRGGSKN